MLPRLARTFCTQSDAIGTDISCTGPNVFSELIRSFCLFVCFDSLHPINNLSTNTIRTANKI